MSIPLIANPILPIVPDQPKGLDDPQIQKTFDSLWKWMNDLSLQMKVLFGSPNSAITLALVQAGQVFPFAGVAANIPSGYLQCNGAIVSQAEYSSLYKAIGTTWNTGGEGAGNFRLPNLAQNLASGAEVWIIKF